MKSLAAALSLTLALPALAADPAVKFPTGFRSWKHVKSMVINQGHPLFGAVGGMHHIYANQKALQGYRTRKFTDGSVIAFDLFEAVDKDSAISEGPRKAVVVMERSAKRFAATDGWGYQVFDPKSKKGTIDAKGAADCAGCHAAQKAAGYVFSELRD
jgi:hypothetical protein